MSIGKELLVILYVFVLMINEPQFVRYCMSRGYGVVISDRMIVGVEQSVQETELGDGNIFHVEYVLNGGVNNARNESFLHVDSLPVQLEVPERAGYNFAGWYTDSSYTNKITEVTADNASNLVLFAKWTNAIDNYYNVEMYSYQTESIISGNQKELKDCAYGFVEQLTIPGMPATREQDYLNNYITEAAQCMQGLCFTPDYILMTAYTESNKVPGALMIFDRETGEFMVTLKMKKDSHLGGIAFDGENVWVCHSGSKTLERIPYEYLTKIAEETAEYCVDASAISDEYHIKNTPSCITCYGGRVWVATYSDFFDSEMVSYLYDKNSDTLTALSEYNIPCRVQGVAFGDQGEVYLSTSLGRTNSSYLKAYSSLLTLTKNPEEPAVKIEMPPCSEEIAFVDNNLYILFESASEKYFEGTDGKGSSTSPIDKLLTVETASIW